MGETIQDSQDLQIQSLTAPQPDIQNSSSYGQPSSSIPLPTFPMGQVEHARREHTSRCLVSMHALVQCEGGDWADVGNSSADAFPNMVKTSCTIKDPHIVSAQSFLPSWYLHCLTPHPPA